MDEVTGGTREDRSRGVPGVIEGFVSPDSVGESPAADDTETDRRDRRWEYRVGGSGTDLRQRDRPETRQERHRRRCYGDHNRADGDERALPAHGIHERTSRAARKDRGDTGHGQRDADLAGIPMRAGEQENREERPDPILHVREEKVQPVERPPIARFCFAGRGIDAGF